MGHNSINGVTYWLVTSISGHSCTYPYKSHYIHMFLWFSYGYPLWFPCGSPMLNCRAHVSRMAQRWLNSTQKPSVPRRWLLHHPGQPHAIHEKHGSFLWKKNLWESMKYMELPSGNDLHSYCAIEKLAIYTELSHQKLWFSSSLCLFTRGYLELDLGFNSGYGGSSNHPF